LRDTLLGYLTLLALKMMQCIDPHRMADFAAMVMRRVGPWLPEHKIGRANLAAAYSEKSVAEIEQILSGMWDNLGRVGAEFLNLDRIWDFDPLHPDPNGRIVIASADVERFIRLLKDGKPALIFAAHLANWEMPALASAANGLPSAVVYRAPNSQPIADAVLKIRAVNMGRLIRTGFVAPVKVAEALRQGLHVGMLVDQYNVQGVTVTFFGRRTKTNAMLARLARQIECPIYGVRVVRLSGHRFRIELTDEIAPARDAMGRVDIDGTMQAITNIIEGWIREHPEQWLWVHRRWR
jgi:KDO2-lipid IV(A) lauroyltransferase